MKIEEVWRDGICKKCGSIIYEKSARHDYSKEAKEACADYMNACSNEECEENYWHYVRDQETLDYFEHE